MVSDLGLDLLRNAYSAERGVAVNRSVHNKNVNSEDHDEIIDKVKDLREKELVTAWYRYGHWTFKITSQGEEWIDENDDADHIMVWECAKCDEEFETLHWASNDTPPVECCPFCEEIGRTSAQDSYYR